MYVYLWTCPMYYVSDALLRSSASFALLVAKVLFKIMKTDLVCSNDYRQQRLCWCWLNDKNEAVKIALLWITNHSNQASSSLETCSVQWKHTFMLSTLAWTYHVVCIIHTVRVYKTAWLSWMHTLCQKGPRPVGDACLSHWIRFGMLLECR